MNRAGSESRPASLKDDEQAGRIRSGRLAGKSLGAAIWILAFPVLLQQTMQACVGLFDKIIAGSLPPAIIVPALDGLGIGSYMGWFLNIAMGGLGIGGGALIARSMGAGDVAQGERALGQAILISVLWGSVVGLVMWFSAWPLARGCQLSPEAAHYCVQYVRCLAVGMPLTAIMLVGSMCLHGAGETVRPSAIAITVNLLNMVFSWALSGAEPTWGTVRIANPFGFDLHVLGIALGTVLSFAVGAVLTLIVLIRGVRDLRLHGREMRPDAAMSRRIVRVGLPMFFEGISMWAVNLLVLLIIGIIAAAGTDGEGLQGAHIIAVQWEAFSFLPGFAIGTAAGALAGQYLGAGNPRMAQRAALVCTAVAVVFMGALGIVFIFGGTLLTRIVSTEPLHLEHAPNLLLICGATQIFFAITMVLRQALRGAGDTRWTFLITTVSSYGVRLPAAWVLGVTLELGLEGIWFGLCGELAVRAALFAARFFHGGWKRLVI
ncbi:MAG: MATE family efflux transporter [Planctomycetota bacterium]